MKCYKAALLVYSLLLNFDFYYNHSIIRVNDNITLLHSCLQRIMTLLFGVEETVTFIFESETDDITFAPEIENLRTITIINKPIEVTMASAFHYNYVIITKELKSLKETTKKLIKSPLWNKSNTPRGKFLVFMYSGNYLNETMEYLWKLDITHLVLVAKDTSDDSLKVFKSTPFYQKGKCVSFRREHLIAPCNLITNLKFPKITTLSGCHIRLVDRQDLSAILKQRGRAYANIIRVMKLVAEILKAHLTFQQTQDIKEAVYNRSENDVIILYNFLARVEMLYGTYDVTNYFLRDRIMWIVPKSAKLSGYKIMNSLFTTTFWMALLVTFLISALVMWFIAKCVPNAMKFRSLQRCLLLILRFSFDSSANILPSNTTLRTLIIFYLLYYMQVSTLFHGKLISALTEPGHELPVSTMEQFADLKLPIVVSKIFKDSILQLKKGPIDTKVRKRMIIVDPYVMLETIMDVAFDRNVTSFSTECLLRKVLPVLKGMIDIISENTGMLPLEAVIIMRKGHYFYHVFNDIVDKVTEYGFLDKILLDFVGEVPIKRGGTKESNVVLTMAHLYPIFLLWAVGLTISILAFVAEKFTKTETIPPTY